LKKSKHILGNFCPEFILKPLPMVTCAKMYVHGTFTMESYLRFFLIGSEGSPFSHRGDIGVSPGHIVGEADREIVDNP